MRLHRRRKADARQGKPRDPTGDAASASEGSASEPEGSASEPDATASSEPRTVGDRIRALDRYSFDYDESEVPEVEARIRRMFYGSKVEKD